MRFLTELQYRKAVFRTLAGIGFTMSLFIAMLAFQDAALVDAANVGILAGSLLAGILATIILKTIPRR